MAARPDQLTAAFQQEYTLRAGIEGTVSETVRAHGACETRYSGLAKTPLQAILTAIAVNLKRAALWLMAKARTHTRARGLACLAPQLAA